MGLLSKIFNKITPKNQGIEDYTKKLSDDFVTQGSNIQFTPNEIEPIYKKKLDNNLYPGEIILLWWVDGKQITHEIPGYFQYQYGIDAIKSIKKLFDKGFIIFSTPYDSLKSLKVEKLKELLKNNDLQIKGKKAELIERVKENINENYVAEFIKDKTYSLSERGMEVTKKYDYVVYGHNSHIKDESVTAATMIESKNKMPTYLKNKDIAWHLLNEAAMTHSKNREYGLLRNTSCSQAEFLKREEKYIDSLVFWIFALTLDLSGMGNSTKYNKTPQYHEVMAIPYIFDEIKSVCSKGALSTLDYDAAYNKAWNIYKNSLIDTGFLDRNNNYKAISFGLNDCRKDIQQFYKKEVSIQ